MFRIIVKFEGFNKFYAGKVGGEGTTDPKKAAVFATFSEALKAFMAQRWESDKDFTGMTIEKME